MAFSAEDRQEIRVIVREESRKVVREEIQEVVRPIEIRQELFEHDIRGMFGDIKSYMDDNAGLRHRVEVLEADVAVLKRSGFGG